MEDKNLWSRRKFSKAILSLQVLVGTGVLNMTTSCAPNEEHEEGEPLNSLMLKILRLAMDEIIPFSDKMPSASEAGGLEYISSILSQNPDLIEAFQQILVRLNDQSKISANEDFENLDGKLRINVLKQYEKEQPDLFNVLKYFVYESYYINETVWKLIGYEPYPTLSAGPNMEPFDENLLKQVKKMDPLYIDIEN